MAKKMYIPVNKNGKIYRIFMNDLVKVHSISKNRRPALPSYDVAESFTKYEEVTDFEFEPLELP
jgi:hypothetical protein